MYVSRKSVRGSTLTTGRVAFRAPAGWIPYEGGDGGRHVAEEVTLTPPVTQPCVQHCQPNSVKAEECEVAAHRRTNGHGGPTLSYSPDACTHDAK